MRVTTLAGSGTQRGLDHGRELASEIAATVTAFKAHLAATGHPPDPLGRRLAASGLVRTAAEHEPDLWAEVVAIAGGARLPLEDILLLVFLDEVWGLTRRAGCSSVARILAGRPADATGPARPATTEIGQTMDLPAWSADRALVLRISSGSGPAALLLAYPGSIGLCGANDAGLGVAVNALPRAPASEDGLGVTFILRRLLTATSLAQAEDIVRTVPHAAGQAYTIAAPDGIASFEADAEAVRRVSTPGIAAVAHTNHYLASRGSESGDLATESSAERLGLVMRCLEQHGEFGRLLTEDVVVDGSRWQDRFITFGAFRAIGDETSVRFIDGAAIRAGHREWTKVAFR